MESVTAYFLNITHMGSMAHKNYKKLGEGLSDGRDYVSPEIQALADRANSSKKLPAITKPVTIEVNEILQGSSSTKPPSVGYVPANVRARSAEFQRGIKIHMEPLNEYAEKLTEQLRHDTAEAPVSILASLAIIEPLINGTDLLWDKDYQTLQSEIENIRTESEGDYFKGLDENILNNLRGVQYYLDGISEELTTPSIAVNPVKSMPEIRPSL